MIAGAMIPGGMIASLTNDNALLISIHQRQMVWDRHETYGQAVPGTRLALVGSQGYLELAVNCRSAAAEARLQVGDTIRIASAKKNSNG